MRIGLMTVMPSASFPMGAATIELVGGKMSVDVECEYKPATPDTAEGPGDDAAVKIAGIRLRSGLALHDTTNTMTLVISAGTDLIELLPERDVERIAEQVLAEIEGRA